MTNEEIALIAALESIPTGCGMTSRDESTFVAGIESLKRALDQLHLLKLRLISLAREGEHLEMAVADYLDADRAWQNDELDDVAINNAQHEMRLAMYSFRKARAALERKS